MKTVLKKLTLILLGVAIFTTAKADNIKVSADEWCPYNCDPNSDKPGYIIEIARIIFEKAGHTLTYEILPWARSIKYVREGKIDGIPGASKGEVPDIVFPDETFGASRTYFFVKKGNPWKFTGLKSLMEVNVGIQDDYEYGSEYDAYFEKNKGTRKVQVVSGTNPIQTNLKKLIKGRIDVVPEDKAVLLNTAQELGILNLVEEVGSTSVKNRDELEELKLYLAFSPKNPKSKLYAKILSDGIRRMRASGELQRILDKYGMKDWDMELEALSNKLGVEN